MVSSPTSIVASGLALRLWYQSGLSGAPALDAKTRNRSPSGRYIIGLTRVWPLLAPTEWRSRSGAPSKLPPTLPWLARNSAITCALKSLMAPSCPPAARPRDGRRAEQAERGRDQHRDVPPGDQVGAGVGRHDHEEGDAAGGAQVARGVVGPAAHRRAVRRHAGHGLAAEQGVEDPGRQTGDEHGDGEPPGAR